MRANPGHTDIAGLIGTWALGRDPLYQQLAEALKQAIARYDLLPGTRLPSERELGRQLAISRTTVLAAYELLKQEGVLESRQGSGTWISYRLRSIDMRVPDADHTASYTIQRVLGTPTTLVPSVIDLATGAFSDAPRLGEFVAEVASGKPLDDIPSPYLPYGQPFLREAVARHMQRSGIAASADDVIITAGIQQAVHLLARTMLSEGDAVVVEDPTWTGLLDVLRSAGLRLIGVPTDEHGVDPGALGEAFRKHSPALAFISSEVHNPTGARLSVERRHEIAGLAARHSVVIVEDLALQGLTLRGAEEPALSTFLKPANSFVLGTFSKVFWPGLRIGWARAPRGVITRMGRLRAVIDCGSDLVGQAIGAQVLDAWDDLTLSRRERLRTAWDRIAAEAAVHLPGFRLREPDGGITWWAELPHGDATAFAQLALRHQVEVVPGPAYSASYGCQRRLRISLGQPPEVLAEGIARLGAAWSDYRSTL